MSDHTVEADTFGDLLDEQKCNAALVLQESLEPVEGSDGVIFPATYAADDGSGSSTGRGRALVRAVLDDGRAELRWKEPSFAGGYNIDYFDDGSNICQIDSVGSQANRMEPLFKSEPYSLLVPQITINIGTDREVVNLLDVGHRAGDALVRFTELGPEIWTAFLDLRDKGNASPLAKISPMSLVFGVWDSRGTQTKVPRVIRSVIRAYDVRRLSRSAQYNPPVDYVAKKEASVPIVDPKNDSGKGENNPLSREGMNDNPAVSKHGGVVAKEIRRDVAINLAAIRALRGSSEDESRQLQRYILGLALVAATAIHDKRFNLREGCQLRLQSEPNWRVVPFIGKDEPLTELTPEVALEFAQPAANDFCVGVNRHVTFSSDTADAWLAKSKKEQDEVRKSDAVMTLLGSTNDPNAAKPKKKQATSAKSGKDE